jgi:hypothetical protein
MGHSGLDNYGPPPGFYPNLLIMFNAHGAGVLDGDIGGFFAEKIVQSHTPAGLSPGMILIEPSARTQHQRIFMIRHLGGRQFLVSHAASNKTSAGRCLRAISTIIPPMTTPGAALPWKDLTRCKNSSKSKGPMFMTSPENLSGLGR